MMRKPNTRQKYLSAAVAGAICCLSGSVYAVPISYGNITLDAEYSLGVNGVQDGMTDPDTSIYSNANGADMYLTKFAGPDSVFFHTYGFSPTPTYFGARASGTGTFTAFTQASYSNTFTNNQSTSLPFIFSFLVDQGEVGFTGTGSGSAELLLSIKVDSVEVARDKTTITMVNGVTSCTEDDLGALGSYMSCGDPTDAQGFGGLQQVFNINVGTFAPGQSFTLNYDIIADVSGSLADGSTGCGGGGYGENGYGDLIAVAAFEGVCGGEGIARSGDPFGEPIFDASGNFITIDGGIPNTQFAGTFQQAQVPEPGSLGLLGIAGLAAGAALRRRRRRQTS